MATVVAFGILALELVTLGFVLGLYVRLGRLSERVTELEARIGQVATSTYQVKTSTQIP